MRPISVLSHKADSEVEVQSGQLSLSATQVLRCWLHRYIEFRKGNAGSLPRRMPLGSSLAHLDIALPFLFQSLSTFLVCFQLDDIVVPWALSFIEQTREPKLEGC